jgi:hypothetical protein
MDNDFANRHENQPPHRPLIAQFGGYLIALAFFALAAGLWIGSQNVTVPSAPTPKINKATIAPVPRRVVMGDPPMTRIAGFDQRCNACHALFESKWDGERPLEQHKQIKLNHGLNDRCMNCHSKGDREKLEIYDGTELPFAQVEQLCASCHGPIARDWERGTHGKTMGSWQRDNPAFHRLVCTACHDPHQPGYGPYEPMPGPHTLRMGEPAHDQPEHLDNKNPLQRWLNPESENGHGDEGDEGSDH